MFIVINEGTKVQNPRRLCVMYIHVYTLYIANIHVHVYTRQYYAYADKCVSVRGSIRKCVKDKSS